MTNGLISRRDAVGLLGAGLLLPFLPVLEGEGERFRIRTITAGIELRSASDLDRIRATIGFLNQARSRFESEGYVVQTIRIATQSLSYYADDWMSDATLKALKRIDELAVEHDVMFNVGPVITGDEYPDRFGDWAATLIGETANTLFTVNIAEQQSGIHRQSIRAAADAIVGIGQETDGGEGNFRFAAIAHSPVGTPFYPAAFHKGPPSFAIGLESPNVLIDAVRTMTDKGDLVLTMSAALNVVLEPIEVIAGEISADHDRIYGGIDVSPAPGIDASIGSTIEAITGAPFGSVSTLSACAAVTDAIKDVSVDTCGYNGLMLPPMEDPVLAQRLSEGRYGIQELLLYSSVCGTGLDVVPLPGSVSVDHIASLLYDVASLAHKWDKPLSARLFPVPGKDVGDLVQFDNPFLVDTRIPPLD
jgi:uncharacterized protein (UPF0210 family)